MNGAPILLQIALRIGAVACVAVGGGNAIIPVVREQTVDTLHWLSYENFAELVGLSQAAPGPNILLLPLIGWHIAGIAGALVALAAFVIPSCTIAVVGSRFLVQYDRSPAVAALKWTLRPVTGGLMLSSGFVLIETAARTWPRPSQSASLALSGLAIGVTFAALRFKVNPLVWLAAAALIGALA